MKEFLSIKEVADYLRVDYKTVYRLIQKAEIPAAMVGGVYRIRSQEVEAYLERQRQALATEASKAVQIKCGRCLRLLAPYEVEGLCTAEGCDAPICRTCWEADPDHRCEQHAISPAERLRLARSKVEMKLLPLLLTSEEARLRETLYLSRFEAKLHGTASLPHPETHHPVKVGDWDAIESRVQDLERFRETVSEQPDVEALCPTNPRLTYRPAKGLVLEVAVYSDLATHLRQGFVTEPTNQSTLFEQLNRAIERADAENSLVVLGLGATAGWEREAAEMIRGVEGGRRPFYHRRLAAVLVDLSSEELIHNPTDGRLDGLVDLFSPKLKLDVVQQVMSAAENMLSSGRTTVSVSEFVEMGLGKASEVSDAFDRLVATHRYAVTNVDKADRLLERRSV